MSAENDKTEVALEGDLKRFRPEEVLQFLGTGEKMGVLTVDAKVMELEIGFRDGRIVYTRATPRGDMDYAGRIFVRAGIVDEQALAYALEVQRRSLKRLGTILVELGYAKPAEVTRVLGVQMHEDLLKFLKLPEGPFHFRTMLVETEPYADPVPVEHALLECLRVLDEWPTIAGDLPSFTAIPRLTDRSADRFAGDDADPLSRGEQVVFDLIDGERTLGEVIECSMLGELEGAKAVTSLISRGYVVVEDARFSFALPTGLAGRAIATATATALIALVLAGSFALRPLTSGAPSIYDNGAAVLTPLARTRVENALEVYRLVHGVYPRSLTQLVDRGVMPESAFPEALRRVSAYERTDGGYRLDPALVRH